MATSVRCRTASRRPWASARSVPSRNRSSSCGRINVRPPPRGPEPSAGSPGASMPRSTATGTPVSLPFTRSAAAAISSPTPTMVTTSSLPCPSIPPRWSSSTPTPAAPMVTSVTPLRQARPWVSVTTTPIRMPAVGEGQHQPFGRGVRILGQQCDLVGMHVGRVDAGGGGDDAQPVLDDLRPGHLGHQPHRLFVDQPAPQRVPLLRIGRRRAPAGPRSWRPPWR